MSQLKKILVIRLSSLGDIILSFPLMKILKEKYPGTELHYITKKKYEEIISINPAVDRVILFEEGDSLFTKRKFISNQKYDLIIDIHNNLRSVVLSIRNAPLVRRYKKENLKKLFLVKFKINLFKEIIPVWKRYLLTIKEYLSDTEMKYCLSELLFDKTKMLDGKYIIVSPASRHFTKTYPAKKFIEAINEFKKRSSVRIVLTGDNSKKEIEICNYIESNCDGVLNLCGKLNLNQLAGLIYNCEYVICNDSAILHLSEALGKRVVSIFGSTVKEFGFFPQLKDSVVLEVKSLDCRPCTHIGRDCCPKGHFRCMNEIELIVNS